MISYMGYVLQKCFNIQDVYHVSVKGMGINVTWSEEEESNGTVSADSGAQRVLYSIQLYYTPFLVALGTVGNCLSVFVFFATKLKKLSSSYYLSALATSDTGFLVALFVSWLNLIDLPLFNMPGICQLSVYLTQVNKLMIHSRYNLKRI